MTRILQFIVLVLLAGVTGCASKAAANRRAQEAFLAGQRLGAAQARELQTSRAPVITVHGDVRQSAVPWFEGITLLEAIVTAGHVGQRPPRTILLHRAGETAQFTVHSVQQSGTAIELEPGDVIELLR